MGESLAIVINRSLKIYIYPLYSHYLYMLIKLTNILPSIDTDGMLTQALLVGNFEAAVDICISADRMVSIA